MGVEMIDPKQLQTHVVIPICTLLTPWNVEQATELLMGTCFQESECCLDIHQLGAGPALGGWQMEPETEELVWNWVQKNPMFKSKIEGLVIPGLDRTKQLIGNLYYSCGMARMLYASISDPLPPASDLNGQAAYYKQYYNTPKGAATTAEYIANWHKFSPYLK